MSDPFEKGSDTPKTFPKLDILAKGGKVCFSVLRQRLHGLAFGSFYMNNSSRYHFGTATQNGLEFSFIKTF